MLVNTAAKMESKTLSGIVLGILAGLKWSFLYTLIVPILNIMLTLFSLMTQAIGWDISQSHMSVDESFQNVANVFSLFLVCGFFIGVVPSTIIGALTGWVIEMFINTFWRQLSPRRAMALGIGTTFFAILALHLCLAWLLGSRNPNWDIKPYELGGILLYYGYFLGLPSIIYIIIGGWAGKKLYSESFEGKQFPNAVQVPATSI
jgi:hypothetical protein